MIKELNNSIIFELLYDNIIFTRPDMPDEHGGVNKDNFTRRDTHDEHGECWLG